MATTALDSATLAQMLHIDSEEETANAVIYQGTAEQYLVNAGCVLDYDDGLFKGLVVSMVSKLLSNPDLLTSLSENGGLTLNGMIAQCRLAQQVKAGGSS